MRLRIVFRPGSLVRQGPHPRTERQARWRRWHASFVRSSTSCKRPVGFRKRPMIPAGLPDVEIELPVAVSRLPGAQSDSSPALTRIPKRKLRCCSRPLSTVVREIAPSCSDDHGWRLPPRSTLIRLGATGILLWAFHHPNGFKMSDVVWASLQRGGECLQSLKIQGVEECLAQ